MNKKELARYICRENLSLVEAMQKIGVNAKGIIYITDGQERLIGSLTDGDIRRWILRTGSLEGTVSQVMYKDTRYLFEGDEAKCFDFMESEKINSVPVINTDFNIKEIHFKNTEFVRKKKVDQQTLQGIPVVIMAGGQGTRLYPYTKILPKPLIPIGDIPILERILNRFYSYDVTDFFVTVNYKKEMTKSYFAEQNPPYEIHYIEENRPLGTAGSIRLIDSKFQQPVIISNCDTLIETDYGKVLDYHIKSQNAMTIISALKNMSIPYGVLHLKKDGIVTSIEEKPQLSYFINTGMYIVNPKFLEKIPENQMFHMTDLADRLLAEGIQVGIYPISENSFLDMGEFEEMKKMEEKINSGVIE